MFCRTLPPVHSAVVKEPLDVSAGVFGIIVLIEPVGGGKPLCNEWQVRTGQVSSGNLASSGKLLASGYVLTPSKEKEIYKIKLKFRVKLMKKIMPKSVLWEANYN